MSVLADIADRKSIHAQMETGGVSFLDLETVSWNTLTTVCVGFPTWPPISWQSGSENIPETPMGQELALALSSPAFQDRNTQSDEIAHYGTPQ